MILFYKILSSYHRLTTFIFSVFIGMKRRVSLGRWVILIYESINTRLQRPNDDKKRNQGTKGFTLVELTVTTTILGVIAAIAVPSILTQLANMEAQRVKHLLENTLSLAKSESYISRQNVLVCLSNNAQQCHRNSDKTLLLFVDKNDNKHFDPQVDILLNQQSLNLKYSTVKLRVGSKRHYTKFWGDSGKPRGHFGHIKYCPTSSYNQSKYQISFNQSGIIKHKLNAKHPTDCGN
ncbi:MULTISPECIES: GspH/FimT family pseudopilin [unclassified Psychrobacter]|uniref:GspH/FimT family protein n=1 Tax=unclassified Psychrobacter TaxID=196806 RepID=UPI0025B2D975|nr:MULTISPECIES: GspH/FimT family pseudopilin [unclassified Psychrobacter]MDN3452306.1 GspH/FimT family pseudopilin [Psychrobacter sp. APC 3350]MDN3502772.1 GspH/FimT family pseudopilin [Psychrobacter sp. 5A.1]